MFRRILALACLLGSSGPGARGAVDDPRECPGVCEQPVSYTLDDGFDDAQRALLQQAMHAWERGTGGRVCFAPGGGDLVVHKLERAEELAPWDPDWAAHIALSKGGHIWIVESSVSDPGELRALGVHEIGHYLGLGHVEDTSLTYMHSRIDDTPEELRQHARLTERDGRDFCAAHRCTCAF